MNFRQLIQLSTTNQFRHDRDLEKRDRDDDQNYYNNKRNKRTDLEREVDKRVAQEVQQYKQEIIQLTKKLRNSREDLETTMGVEEKEFPKKKKNKLVSG